MMGREEEEKRDNWEKRVLWRGFSSSGAVAMVALPLALVMVRERDRVFVCLGRKLGGGEGDRDGKERGREGGNDHAMNFGEVTTVSPPAL
ncbi:unnamed protein product [Ilex paraguariensis]|uniref:Uncharacterized protein n=1 Tax=Ilex paraguariensis TaxID=185542 RepID=A0ABC8R6E5_9AQUA